MNLTPHFSLEEFTASDTAARQGIDNTLPTNMIRTATDTCLMLESIRAFLSKTAGSDISIDITSGYRCLSLNRAIGSADTSDHPKAMAADIKAPDFGTPYEVCMALVPHINELGIGQMIYEFGSWTHVSTRTPNNLVNRIITIDKRGVQAGIVA